MLGELEQRWNDFGPDLARFAAPGVDAGVVVTALAELGLPTDDDLITWFGWHNGATLYEGGSWTIGGWNQELLSLSEAVEHTKMKRKIAKSAADGDAEFEQLLWAPCSFGFTTGTDGSTMVIDLADAAPRPVRLDLRSDPSATQNVVAPSLIAAVRIWLDDFESGYLRWLPNWAWQDSRLENTP